MFYTIKEFSQKENLHISTVYKKIKNNKLNVVIIDDVKYVQTLTNDCYLDVLYKETENTKVVLQSFKNIINEYKIIEKNGFDIGNRIKKTKNNCKDAIDKINSNQKAFTKTLKYYEKVNSILSKLDLEIHNIKYSSKSESVYITIHNDELYKLINYFSLNTIKFVYLPKNNGTNIIVRFSDHFNNAMFTSDVLVDLNNTYMDENFASEYKKPLNNEEKVLYDNLTHLMSENNFKKLHKELHKSLLRENNSPKFKKLLKTLENSVKQKEYNVSLLKTIDMLIVKNNNKYTLRKLSTIKESSDYYLANVATRKKIERMLSFI